MTQEQIVEEIEDYMHHVMWANNYFCAYNSILDGGQKYYQEVCLANSFFTIARYSLISSMIMEIVKLFDLREERCLLRLIDVCTQNIDIFPIGTYYMFWKDRKVANNIEELLALAKKDLEELQPLLMPLKIRRDRYYAHNDKKYFSHKANLSGDCPITQDDIIRLLNFSAGMCNSLLVALIDIKIHPRYVDNDDLLKLLSCAHSKFEITKNMHLDKKR